jgi:hypothetical protein
VQNYAERLEVERVIVYGREVYLSGCAGIELNFVRKKNSILDCAPKGRLGTQVENDKKKAMYNDCPAHHIVYPRGSVWHLILNIMVDATSVVQVRLVMNLSQVIVATFCYF